MLECPPLPDPAASRRMIETCVPHRITGRVSAVTGDTLELEGMTAPLGSICEVQTSSGSSLRGRVIGFRGSRPVLAPMQAMGSLSAGDRVRLVDHSEKLRVGPSLCGRVIDAFGQPLDSKPLPQDLVLTNAQRSAPESLDRPPIDKVLETGVRAIDTMLTCGVGQRLGIFAGSGVGKSTLLGMLARRAKVDRIVIGMIGERGREVQEFIDRCLGKEGLRRSVVVVATSDRPAAQRVSAAWTATAVAESFRDAGENVLLLLDSVTRFAMAQRELGLAAGEPPTTRGYPPSVFSQLPRLVERTGRTKTGSITAFYAVLVEGDDNNEPIADTLRGLLDGHIVLNRKLAAEAHWPPIDLLASLSRLQPHVASPELLKASVEARGHLATYAKNEDLISIGAYRVGTDAKIDRAISMRDSLKRVFTQQADEHTPFADASALLQACLSAPPQPAMGLENERVAAAQSVRGEASTPNPEGGPQNDIVNPTGSPNPAASRNPATGGV